jgi:predicted HTH domain antitoxin
VARTLELEFSEEAFAALRRSPAEFARELRLAAAIHWYVTGRISMERAAGIAGLDRIDFLQALTREKQPSFVVDFDDLAREINRG